MSTRGPVAPRQPAFACSASRAIAHRDRARDRGWRCLADPMSTFPFQGEAKDQLSTGSSALGVASPGAAVDGAPVEGAAAVAGAVPLGGTVLDHGRSYPAGCATTVSQPLPVR